MNSRSFLVSLKSSQEDAGGTHVAGFLVPARATADERVRCHFELPQPLSSTVAPPVFLCYMLHPAR